MFPMKILLTGAPGVGKSTVLKRVREQYRGEAYGIVASDIRDASGERQGFIATNQTGEQRVFAHRSQIYSKYVVGGKYFVDLQVIDHFIVPELEEGLRHPSALTFLDEIGRMQSFSPLFLDTVARLIESRANLLATIVFDPEPWSLWFKSHPRVTLIEVTRENRDLLPNHLLSLLNSEI